MSRDNFYHVRPAKSGKAVEGGEIIRVSAEKLAKYLGGGAYVTAARADFEAQQRAKADAAAASMRQGSAGAGGSGGAAADGLDEKDKKALIEIATGLEIKTHGLNKAQLVEKIREARAAQGAGTATSTNDEGSGGSEGGSEGATDDAGNGGGETLESLTDEKLAERATELGIETEGKSRDALLSEITDKLAEQPAVDEA